MNDGSRVTVSRPTALAAGLALLAIGAGIGYVAVRLRSPADRPAAEAAPAPSMPAPAAETIAEGPLPDVVVPITQALIDRAGIIAEVVGAGAASASLRIPGIVEPNAYKQVEVTPVAGGRVMQVTAALGDRVRRGQPMAQLYSPDLAEAQNRLLSIRAELEASTLQLRRTERLVAIGAASQQEVEQVRAQHAARENGAAAARSQLVLLGMTPGAIERLAAPSEMSATIAVPAPIDGVVTERLANPGLNVDPSTKLFTVVDLSTVWIIGDLYEKDFSRVRIGSAAVVTTKAYGDRPLEGRVSYIDPQVNPDTRTARVRVEVPNPRQELRLGMFAELQIRDVSGGQVVTVPRSALQNVAARHVVYLSKPGEPGRFVEREVRAGAANGDRVEVLAGLRAGDVVVTTGSFFVRAERERLGLRQPASDSSAPQLPSERPAAADGVLEARIMVTDKGFEPASVTIAAGRAARLTFVRASDKTCATEISVPVLNLRRRLPLNQEVTVEVPARQRGEVVFTCGMNMLRGTLVVR